MDGTGISGHTVNQFHWDWADLKIAKYKKDRLNFPAVIFAFLPKAKQIRSIIIWFVANGEKELKIELDGKRVTQIVQLCTNEDLKKELVIALDKSWMKN